MTLKILPSIGALTVACSGLLRGGEEERITQPADADAGRSRPNILFCLADDWGWPHAGAYGDKVVKTPAFDRLAAEGVLFEHAFVSSPSCTPSRNALLTGQSFYRLGEGANLWSTLDVRHPNFMFLLRDAGYQIGHWRKAWGPGDHRAGGYEEHPMGKETTFVTFMSNRDRSKPFCFWFGTSDPHRPYKKGSGRERGISLESIHLPAFYPNENEIRADIADYYVEVQRWDRDVGAAIELLEKAKILDDTLIVMSGDHGMPFPRCKGNLYDQGSRVPLAFRWGNGIRPGRTLTDFASFTDLAPTFLEAAGVDVPAAMTGRSLLPLLASAGEGRVDPTRDFVVYGRERHVPAQAMPSRVGYPSRAIRTDGRLLILNLESGRWPAGVPKGATHPMGTHADCDNGPTKSLLIAGRDTPALKPFYDLCFARRGPVELYDCAADPDQVKNLAADPRHTPELNALRERLVAYLRQTGDPRFTEGTVMFDDSPYRAGYLKPHIQKQRGGGR